MLASNLNNKETRIWSGLKKRISDEPVAVFMMGIPASGKSTTVNVVLEHMGYTRSDFLDIDPDIFMESLNDYNNTRARDFNKSGVVIASNIMKKIHSSSRKYKYIYFGTGKNYASYITMINKAKKAGYMTVLVNVEIDISTAINRASKRSRKVSPSVISNIDRRLKTKHTRTISKRKVSLTGYEILHDKVDQAYVINNNGSTPEIVYHKN
jgi:predicted ABC-type ATPase